MLDSSAYGDRRAACICLNGIVHLRISIHSSGIPLVWYRLQMVRHLGEVAWQSGGPQNKGLCGNDAITGTCMAQVLSHVRHLLYLYAVHLFGSGFIQINLLYFFPAYTGKNVSQKIRHHSCQIQVEGMVRFVRFNTPGLGHGADTQGTSILSSSG